MEVVFGVKSSDIEEAYVWVERATGLVAEARENDAWGGNWSVILLVECTDAASRALRGIEMDSNHFEKLSTKS